MSKCLRLQRERRVCPHLPPEDVPPMLPMYGHWDLMESGPLNSSRLHLHELTCMGHFCLWMKKGEFVIVSEWKTGEEIITERVVSYLHSTLTLGFVPLQRTGRIRTRNGKQCFSKRLDETQSTRSGFICSISGSYWVCLETAALA